MAEGNHETNKTPYYYASAYCCVPNCSSRLMPKNMQKCNDEKLSFHHFPNENVFVKLTWRGRVNLRDEWKRRLHIGRKITYGMRVCSLHFKRSDYILPGDENKVRRLKRNACPAMNIPFTSRDDQREKTQLEERKEFKDSSATEEELSEDNNSSSNLKSQDENSLKEKGSTSCLATCRIVDEKGERTCVLCLKKMKMRYQLSQQQKSYYLCSDFCFQSFCDKQNLVCVLEPGKVVENSVGTCIACDRIIQDGQGYNLSPGKMLCSEECKKNYEDCEEIELCAQCDQKIRDKVKCITWTSKVFCNEDCLDKYQTVHSHNCPNCQTVMEKASLGKFCLYTKTDIQDFCSLQCLEVFKEDPKVCKVCGNFIFSGSKDPLSSEDKSFYCEKCVVAHTTSCRSPELSSQNGDMTGVGLRIMQEDSQEAYDEDTELSVNEALNSRCCTCNRDMLQKCRKNIVLQLSGTSKRFCSKICMNKFVLVDRKFPCFWCKDKKPITDMVERVDSINHVQLFCSLHCLSLFRVSLNATSSKDIKCDNCNHDAPAAYHLTMSDASVRNFCSYECVLEFQDQFEDDTEIANTASV